MAKSKKYAFALYIVVALVVGALYYVSKRAYEGFQLPPGAEPDWGGLLDKIHKNGKEITNKWKTVMTNKYEKDFINLAKTLSPHQQAVAMRDPVIEIFSRMRVYTESLYHTSFTNNFKDLAMAVEYNTTRSNKDALLNLLDGINKPLDDAIKQLKSIKKNTPIVPSGPMPPPSPQPIPVPPQPIPVPPQPIPGSQVLPWPPSAPIGL